MSVSHSNGQNKPTLAEILASKTTLPSDILVGEFRLEIRGRNMVIVNGCKRILEYSPEKMRLSAKSWSVSISGESLVCSSYHDGAICIEGYVCEISFDEAEENR